MGYIKNFLLGLDQLGNTLIGGSPDETISARSGRLKSHPGWKQLAWLLNKIQPQHVERAVCDEENGSQNDPAYKDYYKGQPDCSPKSVDGK